MNIYEDEGLEQKFEELTDLMGQLVLDILLVSNDNLKLTTCDNRILTTLSGERKAG